MGQLYMLILQGSKMAATFFNFGAILLSFSMHINTFLVPSFHHNSTKYIFSIQYSCDVYTCEEKTHILGQPVEYQFLFFKSENVSFI